MVGFRATVPETMDPLRLHAALCGADEKLVASLVSTVSGTSQVANRHGSEHALHATHARNKILHADELERATLLDGLGRHLGRPLRRWGRFLLDRFLDVGLVSLGLLSIRTAKERLAGRLAYPCKGCSSAIRGHSSHGWKVTKRR